MLATPAQCKRRRWTLVSGGPALLGSWCVVKGIQSNDRRRRRNWRWSALAHPTPWRFRLSFHAPGVLVGFGQAPEDAAKQALAASLDRRDALIRLLKTDLALRLSRCDEGDFPTDLEDLVPSYLSSAPIDPYTDRFLVYRRTGDDYVLYSAAMDGEDNGGRFGAAADVMNIMDENFDLEVDASWR